MPAKRQKNRGRSKGPCQKGSKGITDRSINVDVQSSLLVAIVGAVRMYHRTKYLSVSDFYKIVEKVQRNGLEFQFQDEKLSHGDLGHFSEPEEALFQLLAVAPTQFCLVCRNVSNKDVWCLEQNPEDHTGITQIQGRETAKISESTQKATLDALRKIRTSMTTKPKCSANKRPRESSIEAIITSDMTVDERVRARHEAKVQRREKSVTSITGKVVSDGKLLVRAADTLWKHTKSTKTSRCIFVMKEVVQWIRRDQVSSHTSLKQSVEAVLELAKLAPAWMTVQAGKSGSKMAQDASVCLQSSKYAVARAQLLGKPAPLRSNPILSKQKPFRSPAPSTSKVAVVTNSAKTMKPLAAQNLKRKRVR